MNVFFEFALTLVAAMLIGVLAWLVLPSTTRGLSRPRANRIFYGLVVLYVAVFGVLAILRHDTFNSYGYDLGIFDQVVWNSLHGPAL